MRDRVSAPRCDPHPAGGAGSIRRVPRAAVRASQIGARCRRPSRSRPTPCRSRADAIVVFVPQPAIASGSVAAADLALDGLVGACIADGEITGETGQISVIHTGGLVGAPRLVVVGVGDGSVDAWRQAGRAAGARLRAIKARTVAALPRRRRRRARDGTRRRGRLRRVPVRPLQDRTTRARAGRAAGLLGGRHAGAAAPREPAGRARSRPRAISPTRPPTISPRPPWPPGRPSSPTRRRDSSARCSSARTSRSSARGRCSSVAQGSAEPPKLIVLRYTPKRRAAIGRGARPGGQGRHLRYRRDLDQARLRDGGDEARHGRRRGRGRGRRPDRAARRCRSRSSPSCPRPRTCPAAPRPGPAMSCGR